MMEQQKKRVELAVADLINDMYKTHLRKMQSEMHVCAATCCDDSRGTLDTVQQCIEGCAVPLSKAQDYLQQELGQFQGRLQTCVMHCNDEARLQLPNTPKDSDMSKYQHQFETCTVKCVDQHLGLLPAMMKSMKNVLAKGPKAMSKM